MLLGDTLLMTAKHLLADIAIRPINSAHGSKLNVLTLQTSLVTGLQNFPSQHSEGHVSPRFANSSKTSVGNGLLNRYP